jgi:phage shock protein PspC (stress-responsive transcriptional regulator)
LGWGKESETSLWPTQASETEFYGVLSGFTGRNFNLNGILVRSIFIFSLWLVGSSFGSKQYNTCTSCCENESSEIYHLDRKYEEVIGVIL